MVLTHGYGAVRNTVRFVCERAGARMVEAEVPFPHPTPIPSSPISPPR